MASNSQSCGRCAQLQAENARLRQEIARLRRIIQRLADYIDAALRVARGVETYLLIVQRKSQRVLSQPSGVPRATWSLHQGRLQVANRAQAGVSATIQVLESARELAKN